MSTRVCVRMGCILLCVAAAPLAAAETTRPVAAVKLQIGADTTYITAPLDADGYPDYVEAINERLSQGVSREENFWVLMWPAIGNAERSREDYIAAVEQKLEVSIAREPRLQDPLQVAGLKWNTPEGDRLKEQWDESLKRPWTADEFPEIARWLDANAQVLEEVHAACQRPKAYAPAVAGEDEPFQLISILLPHVQALRGVARLLSARAMLRVGEGDVDGAWQDLLDLQRLAEHSERGWTLIEALVGYAIRSIALQPTAHWFARCELNQQELLARWIQLRPLLEPAPMHRSIDTERFMYLDTVIMLMSGRAKAREMADVLGTGIDWLDDGPDSAGGIMRARRMLMQAMLMGGDVNETLRYGNRMYDELIEALKPATHLERAALLKVIDERVAGDGALTRDAGALVRTYLFSSRQEVRTIPGRVMVGLLMPAITQVERAHTRTQAYAALLQATVQACVYRELEGTLPINLAELTEANFAGELLDPFTGDLLRVRRDETGLTIYSVGINGKDDGGRTYGEGVDVDDLRVIVPVRE